GPGGVLRVNGDFRAGPERMLRRHRLLAEHVQGGRGDVTVVDGFQQVGLDQVFAPTNIDHHRTGQQFAEVVVVENVTGSVGQWQGVDQDAGSAQKAVQVLFTGKALDAGQLMVAAGPAVNPVVQV